MTIISVTQHFLPICIKPLTEVIKFHCCHLFDWKNKKNKGILIWQQINYTQRRSVTLPKCFWILLSIVCPRLSCSVTHRNCALLFHPSAGDEIPLRDLDSWLNMSVWPTFPMKTDNILYSMRWYSALEVELKYTGILHNFPSRISYLVFFILIRTRS